MISKLLDISNKGKICFIGSRVNFINWDEPITNDLKVSREDNYPIKVEYNYLMEELVFF